MDTAAKEWADYIAARNAIETARAERTALSAAATDNNTTKEQQQ